LSSDELEELRVFLSDHVSGFEELEVLLFFVRAPRQAWNLADVAGALNVSPEMVEATLRQLTTAGAPITPIAAATTAATTYRYTPNVQTERLLEGLARAYDEQRLTVLQIMSSNAMDRVRSMAARRLADAFRLDRSKK
jgi:hypothetical protein